MTFDRTIAAAVTAHMNDDHPEDNLLIVRAFGRPGATTARMVDVGVRNGTWVVTDSEGEHELTVPWLGGEIAERPQIRRAVVALYRRACEILGVTAREEHAAGTGRPPHAADPHAPGSSSDPHPQEPGFARRLRDATRADHSDSEGATFMIDIMRGRGTLTDYTDLVAQHWFIYEALDAAADALHADPLLAALHPEGIGRMAALERDLAHLLGPRWRTEITPVPAAIAYAERIRQVAAQGWTAGIVAHHYTRYLGDLSGGQLIARRASAQFGFDGDGVAFYDFAELGDPAGFKTAYREVLDAFGAALDEAAQDGVLDEVRLAYRFNTDLFLDLDEARAAA